MSLIKYSLISVFNCTVPGADRHTEKQDSVILESLMRNHRTLVAQRVYYIEVNRDEGLLHTVKQGGRVYGVQLDQGDRLSSGSKWVKRRLCGEAWALELVYRMLDCTGTRQGNLPTGC